VLNINKEKKNLFAFYPAGSYAISISYGRGGTYKIHLDALYLRMYRDAPRIKNSPELFLVFFLHFFFLRYIFSPFSRVIYLNPTPRLIPRGHTPGRSASWITPRFRSASALGNISYVPAIIHRFTRLGSFRFGRTTLSFFAFFHLLESFFYSWN
jgi:hypothetical protein